MTAINVFFAPDRVHMVTDGAAIEQDGRLARLSNKAVPIPHLNAVIGARGAAGLPGILSELITSTANGYDEVKACIIGKFRSVIEPAAERQRAAGGGEFEVDLVVAGLSESAGPNCYVIASHANHPGVSAWTLIPIEFALLTPENDALAADIEPLLEGDCDVEAVAVRALEGQRRIRVPHGTAGEVCIVGGFAQLTTVAPDGITSRILKRWPDKIGQLL